MDFRKLKQDFIRAFIPLVSGFVLGLLMGIILFFNWLAIVFLLQVVTLYFAVIIWLKQGHKTEKLLKDMVTKETTQRHYVPCKYCGAKLKHLKTCTRPKPNV